MNFHRKRYEKLDANKGKVILNKDELESEKELIKFYYETEDIGMALRLAREFYINIVLYEKNLSDKFFDTQTREFQGCIDESIRKARNYVSHFGFSKSTLCERVKELIDTPLDEFKNNNFMKECLRRNVSKTAILSPLGTTQGALFTVLKNTVQKNL
ncbi:TM1812 family CRISPR-associated protein [Thermosipho affectus]|uniref:TM1812 family CRISPR-associated protein n=2 Tax=Thermosipho TaxID=2420 RepID=UPI002FCDEFFD